MAAAFLLACWGLLQQMVCLLCIATADDVNVMLGLP